MGVFVIKGLNSNQLKFIAIVAMTIDHLAWTFFPGFSTDWLVLLCHVIGRLTAPIMWFFIAEGFYHTRNFKKYATRLFILAFISHFAYNFGFGISILPFKNGFFNQTGVVWSLAWGLMLLYINSNENIKQWQKIIAIAVACVLTFPSDWSCVATMAILFIGTYRNDFKKQMMWLFIWSFVYAAVYFVFIDKLYAVIQLGTVLTIPLLRLYNGERGNWKPMGKLFYFYYPAHLVVCGVIRVLLWGADFSTLGV